MSKKLVDMTLTAADARKMTEPSIAADAPRYPWGLSISIDGDALERLGIEDLPEVGESLQLRALVEVTSTSINESQTEQRRSLGLQITAMCLEPAPKKSDASETLYKD